MVETSEYVVDVIEKNGLDRQIARKADSQTKSNLIRVPVFTS